MRACLHDQHYIDILKSGVVEIGREAGTASSEDDLQYASAEFSRKLGQHGQPCIKIWDQGQWGEAEALFLHVMERKMELLGSEHPSTLIHMADHALIALIQGR